MKNLFSVIMVFCIGINAIQAQFQKIQKTQKSANTEVKSTPREVSPSQVIIGAVVIPPGNFGNAAYKVFDLPDGEKLTMTLRLNPVNLPQNFGGIVKETSENKTVSDRSDKICTSDIKMITAQSSTFMNVNYNQQAIHIFPGAIYTFSDFFSGNFRAIEQSRNPISISTDNLANSTGPVFEVVQNPTGENIKSKIANIIRPFSTTTGSAGIQYRVFNSENDAEMSIKLSAGGGYAGFKASGGYSGQQTETKYFLTIDAIKPLYTLTTSMPTNGYFSDKSVEASNPNMIVLKSVSYGARVLANLEITLQSQKDDIDFKASFGADSSTHPKEKGDSVKTGTGVSANFAATFNYLKTAKSASSTANVYVIGGPLNTTIFDKDKLQEQITELISKCNYQTAQPIAYSFTDVNGNVLGVETATDKFPSTKCVPKGSIYKLVAATVQIITGKDKKEQGSNASISLINSDNIVVFENDNNNLEFTSQNNIVLDSRGLDDNYIAETSFSKKGGFIDIFFEPKPIFFDFDQWNINGVIVKLTFLDQNKATDVKLLDFSNAAVLLKKGEQRLRLPFDKMYNAGNAFLPGL